MQRYRCGKCGKTFSDPKPQSNLFGTKQAVNDQMAALALQMLVEGNSIRSTERVTGLHRDTIMRLLVTAGERCEALMANRIKDVPVRDVQGDEIWGYVGKRKGTSGPTKRTMKTIGDAWCFIGIERHTKLVLAFELGKRNEQATDRFMEKLVSATFDERFQLSTDGFACYRNAVYGAFGESLDYAQSIKTYAQADEPQRRYSPAKIVTVENKPIYGNPKDERISTSHIERQNGSLR